MDNVVRLQRPWLFSFISIRAESYGSILYNPFLGQELQLDAKATEMLGLFNGKRTVEGIADAFSVESGIAGDEALSKVRATLDALESIYAVTNQERETPQPPVIINPRASPPKSHLSAPKNVTWEVTRACNLHCPHCLNDSGKPLPNELDTKSALGVIKELKNSGIMGVSLSGGEPFRRPDIFTLIDALNELHTSVDFATNGVGISNRMIRQLGKRDIFHVQVSIDGLGREHDEFRGRKGAFEQALSTIRRLRDEGIAVSISTTATARNIDAIERIIDFALFEGCSVYKAIPFIQSGRGKKHALELGLQAAQYRRLCEIIFKKSRELAGRMRLHLESTMHYLIDPEVKEPAACGTRHGKIGCIAGNGTLNIGPDGTVTPCPFLRDFPVGNIATEGLVAIWDNAATLNTLRSMKPDRLPGRCRECGFLSTHCGGGCRAAAFLHTGDFFGMDPTCFKGE